MKSNDRKRLSTLASKRFARCLYCSFCLWIASSALIDPAQAQDVVAAAQQYGKARTAVSAQSDGLIVCEAEEFQVANPGWQAKPWGQNYYSATFANTFLSRKAFLGAPEQGETSTASIQVQVPADGRYLALVRYEAAYRFETQFRLVIEQQGRTVFDRLYGARKNLKIWAFSQKLKTEVAWDWGASENVVWEGHDAAVNLRAGLAKVTLIAAEQPEPAAKRNVDLVMLTTDVDQVQMRIEKERYLPLDGLLTQSGDVFMRITNQARTPVEVRGQKFPGGPCQQHSPYWVHLRDWKPLEPVSVAAGQRTDWIDVGGLLDTLNDGQWGLSVQPPATVKIEFAVKAASGKIESINEFDGTIGELPLAFHADTRYSRQLRHREQVLYDLLDYLNAQPAGKRRRAPKQSLIYGYTFDTGLSPKHDAAIARFKKMFALHDTKATGNSTDQPRGYIDVRSVKTDKLEQVCRDLGDTARQIAVVSLGDEIALPNPSGDAVDEGFHDWLRSQHVKPSDIHPAAVNDWNQVHYQAAADQREKNPLLYYWSQRYRYHFGIQAIKQRTDILRKQLPNAHVGANFSPHYPTEHSYLGETFKWVQCFREEGMTLPWSEDYIFQLPVGTPQMNHINLDLFRAGLRARPDAKICYYVMPHWPGNTPETWRRLFYGAIGHGMQIVNLFEFRPVQVAYTENHVTNNDMYAMVLRSFRELAAWEDIVQSGHVRPAEAALWFSQTGDIWGDNHGSFAAAKRALYTAIRHQQIPLDFVVEADALDGTLAKYRVLYLTDNHISLAASRKIADWVRDGGVLLATAGAGMFDEGNRPNAVLRELLGVDQTALDEPGSQITYIKQDLPFTDPIDEVRWPRGEATVSMPVIGVRSRVRLKDAMAVGSFRDGSPAIVTRDVGRGRTVYCAFLPGLSYYQPAVPRRPVDRGSSNDAMCHFLPTEFHSSAAELVAWPAAELPRTVTCSEPLVESTVIRSNQGVAIPLVNWTGTPIEELTVTIRLDVPHARVELASGRPLKLTRQDDHLQAMFALDVADALIFR